MNAEKINKLLSNVVQCETELDKMSGFLEKADKNLQEQEAAYGLLWDAWDQQVATTGQALEEAKKEYGAGWKRDFDTFGFSVSYTVACRYIACARHPEASDGITSIEEWAQASVELDRAADEKIAKQEQARKRRAAGRKSQNVKQTECVESNGLVGSLVQEVLPSQPEHSADTPDTSDAQFSASLDFLDRAINGRKKYAALKSHWCIVAEKIRCGRRANLRLVSSDDDDDTVASGGTQQTSTAGTPEMAGDSSSEQHELLEYATA